jgi:phosphonate transport system substrate-binding protein
MMLWLKILRTALTPVLSAVLLSAFLVHAPAQALEAEPQRDYLVFGFLPILSSEKLVRRFSPLVEYLSTELDIDIRMETAPDFAEFVRRTRDEKRYDILFTAPHLYYLANRVSDYRALVRVDKPGMKAVIVVPLSGGAGSVEDLRGRRLATTGPLALSTLLVKNLLLSSAVDPDRDLTLVATPSHNANLLSSYQGATDASALMLPVYRRMRPDIIDTMKIIAETQSVPHIPIAVAPWMDERAASRLRATLLGMGDTERGRTLLRQLDWPGFTPTQDSEYDGLQWITDQLVVD